MRLQTTRSGLIRRTPLWAVLLLAVALSACGGGDGADGDTEDTTAGSGPETSASAGGDTTTADNGGEGDGEASLIRFAFAPDPVWDHLSDTGALDEWQESSGVTIETTSSWDFFTYFAGGHGDMVSMGTYHMPVLEAQTDEKVVAFGQYNHQRVSMFRRATDDYETLADVPTGSKICVSEPTGNTVVWSVIADQLHDLDYRVGSGDFELVIQDHFVMPDLLERGECEVAAFIPEAGISWLREGSLVQMYDGRQPWQIYQDICECDHRGIMGNLFVTTSDWFDSHPEEAAAFLELWETGLTEWEANKEEIIRKYPQHFSVEADEDIDFIIDYMSGENDWFSDTVYLDEEWVTQETKFYDYMVEAGWMEADQEHPRFEVVEP